MPSALQHDQDSQHSADADSASSQHATAGGQEESCSVGQQPTVPEVGPTQASQQTSSSDDLAATAVPPHVASASVTQHTKHAASHEQLPATKSVSATADTTTSRVSAAADGEAAATVADDKGAGSSMTAAADAVSKQSCGQSAPPTLVTASTIGVSARPGAVRKPGGDAEGQRCNLPAAAPAQTAAEMLSWLDATLSAKKPLKVAAKGPPKVQLTAQGPHIFLFERDQGSICLCLERNAAQLPRVVRYAPGCLMSCTWLLTLDCKLCWLID